MQYGNLQDSPSLGKLTEADLDAAIARKAQPHRLSAWLAAVPLRPPVPPVFRADLGRKRAFLSFRDAAAYDRGYRQHPHDCHAEPGTPEAIGWADARDDADGYAAMDDVAEWARAHAEACGVHTP